MFYDFIIKNWRIITLITISVLFLLIYSWLPYQVSKDGEFRLASPDGTANYFWAENYAKNNSLTYFEPLNLIANDIVIPRSVISEQGTVKPVSFLGIILIYGWIAKIFGIWVIKYLTPLFAVLGALCFFGIIKKIFNTKIAWISFLMCLVLAPYWYYTSRSMFHNVLMVDLVLMGIYLLINSTRIEQIKRLSADKAGINTNFIFYFLAGIFIGLAIITRVSELIWILPILFLTWVFYFKQIKLDKILIFICGIILALMPMLYYNQILYGDFLKFGYPKPAVVEVQNESVILENNINNIQPVPVQNFGAQLQEKINNILPFGFYPKQIVKNFYYYFIYLFWYLFWPALFGGILFLYKYKERNKQQWLYFTTFCVTSIILVIFYGSWNIADNIRPDAITIGNSYTRYWLPMYIMSLPFAILFFTKIADILSFPWKNEWIPAFAGMTKYSITGLFIIAFFILNIQATVYGQDEGLIYVKQGIEENKERAKHINLIIENEAIIITKHLDKFFWPDKKVISADLNDDFKNQQYQKLINLNIPLYYYGFIYRPQDLEFLNNTKFKDLNLKIEEVELNEEAKLGLYKIIPQK